MNENNRFSEQQETETEIIQEEQTNNEILDMAYGEESAETVETTTSNSWIKEFYEWVSSIAVAVVLALVINQFFFALVQVDGKSMEPTLSHGERLVVRKAFYEPKQKDIVILKSGAIQKYIVKRIVALPGQTVAFDASMQLTVNGTVMEEPYINEKQLSKGNLYTYPLVVPKQGEPATIDFLIAEASLKLVSGTMTVEMQSDGTAQITGSALVEDGLFEPGKTTYKQDCYFVMGDNRNHSSDSRTLGLIPESEIVGKSSLRVLPFTKFGFVE